MTLLHLFQYAVEDRFTGFLKRVRIINLVLVSNVGNVGWQLLVYFSKTVIKLDLPQNSTHLGMITQEAFSYFTFLCSISNSIKAMLIWNQINGPKRRDWLEMGMEIAQQHRD